MKKILKKKRTIGKIHRINVSDQLWDVLFYKRLYWCLYILVILNFIGNLLFWILINYNILEISIFFIKIWKYLTLGKMGVVQKDFEIGSGLYTEIVKIVNLTKLVCYFVNDNLNTFFFV